MIFLYPFTVVSLRFTVPHPRCPSTAPKKDRINKIFQGCIIDLSGEDLTQKIIACEYAVHNKVDAYVLEKVYTTIEQDAQGLKISRQVPLYTGVQGIKKS